jgi:hypothetical protein
MLPLCSAPSQGGAVAGELDVGPAPGAAAHQSRPLPVDGDGLRELLVLDDRRHREGEVARGDGPARCAAISPGVSSPPKFLTETTDK